MFKKIPQIILKDITLFGFMFADLASVYFLKAHWET